MLRTLYTRNLEEQYQNYLKQKEGRKLSRQVLLKQQYKGSQYLLKVFYHIVYLNIPTTFYNTEV